MLTTDIERIFKFHASQLQRYALGDPRSLGYSNSISQVRRFEVISQVYDFGGKSVLDVGCGVGDLAEYLDDAFQDVRYTGVDINPDFLRYARTRPRSSKRQRFLLGNFCEIDLPRVDAVVASGLLSYRTSEDLLNHMIESLYRLALDVLVFNVLDGQKMFPSEFLVGRDVQAVYSFCRGLCSDVELITGYLYHDATFVLRRDLGSGIARAAKGQKR